MGFFDDLFSSPSFNKAKSSQCFYNELYGKCGGCTSLNPSNCSSSLLSGYKYKCLQRGSYVSWNERACSKVNYLDPEKVNTCERYKIFRGRNYYILTAIFEILGIDMNNNLYKEISNLIDSVREDDATEKEAIGYDTFGLELANKLRNDDERVDIANFLLHNYLVKVYCASKLNKRDEAIEIYKEMVEYLFIRYRKIENNFVKIKLFEK